MVDDRGADVRKLLAAALRQRKIPFAFLTGYGREALPEGFQEALVLTKPVREEQLLAALDSIIAGPVEAGEAAPEPA